jgi:hypothetical protein
MEEPLVTVASFSSVSEADRAATVLRSCGIECFFEDEHFTAWFPHLAPAFGGVKLQVKESQAAEAMEILRQSAS